MFSKTTLSITIAAIVAIVLSTQGPASAAEVGTVEYLCYATTLCPGSGAHEAHDLTYPHAEPEGTGDPFGAGLPADVPGVGDGTPDATITLPDDVIDGMADIHPVPPLILDLDGLPIGSTDPDDESESGSEPVPEPHTDEPAPETVPAHVDHSDAPESADTAQATEPIREIESTTTSTPTTATVPTDQQDDDVDKVVAAAIDLTTSGDSGEVFDPAMAALFGALGALGLFTVGTAAFVIGRRGS